MTVQQRNDAWTIFRLIGERDMPANNTAERLVQRSKLPEDRVVAALELLWNDDAGFIRADTNPRTHERGYFVDPKSKRKTPADLDSLYPDWLEKDDDEDEDEDDEDWDEDDDGDDDA